MPPNDHLTARQISEQTGMPYDSLTELLRKYEFTRSLLNAQREKGIWLYPLDQLPRFHEIARMHKENLTLASIANALRVNEEAKPASNSIVTKEQMPSVPIDQLPAIFGQIVASILLQLPQPQKHFPDVMNPVEAREYLQLSEYTFRTYGPAPSQVYGKRGQIRRWTKDDLKAFQSKQK